MATWICEWCSEPFTSRGTAHRRFCSRAHADDWTRRDKPSAEWLRAEYVDKGRTANDIAREVGRDPKRVWEWLIQAGIPTRGRGTVSYNAGQPSPMRGKKHTPEAIAKITAARRRTPREAYANNGSYLRERRGANHPNWKGGHTPERQAFYTTPEWREAVKTVWARADARCERCGKHHNTAESRGTFHVHHIIGFANVATRAEPSNLALLCAQCHRWVHGKHNTDREFLA